MRLEDWLYNLVSPGNASGYDAYDYGFNNPEFIKLDFPAIMT